MNVEQLILEVGRKCNLSCKHCLRGPAQNLKMSYEDAISTINQFEEINSIVFTGGEPTLYADEICKIIDYIINEKKDVFGFYIATNGVKTDMKLLLKLVEFYGYILSIGGEPEYCSFDISTDQFHPTISEMQKNMLKGFSFVTFRNEISEAGIINEGNAYENGIGYRNLITDKPFYCTDDDYEYVETVYVNAKGYVLPDCDYSYKTQDEMNPYNIKEKPIQYIVSHYNIDSSLETAV